jgi:alpha-mannosidase
LSLRIDAAESTDLFVGDEAAPRQVLRVRVFVEAPMTDLTVTASAAGEEPQSVTVTVPEPGSTIVDVPVRASAAAGTVLPVRLVAASGPDMAVSDAQLVVAEPGWTMFMVSHFHYDPVWWTTQAAYTSEWDATDWPDSPRMTFQQSGFKLVKAHLELARNDPDYCFVLAEVDYLKPYWDAQPQDRALLRRLIAEGRVEVMGGTYNEPNTNLTHVETTIRNFVHGAGFQRDVMGADPRTAWQLDVFGHDPQFPGLAAAAGLDSSSWARGPFHQWGPMLNSPFDSLHYPVGMQFPSEFEWISPSGRGVLTSYMAAHYSAGWRIDSAASLEEAMEAAYSLFAGLKLVASTRNVLLPVGTDYSPPNKWVTDIQRHWRKRYVWPRFVCALPREFFAAVRAEFTERGVRPLPETRDMNPIYTGKDVSYIDTKQAQRAAETTLLQAETLATFAALLGGRYPDAGIDKAWRQLIYGAHHDGITGSESDQVYLDLLTSWREAHDVAREVRDRSMAFLAAHVDTEGSGRALIVTNTLSWPRTEVVSSVVAWPEPGPQGLQILDDTGRALPVLVENVERHAGGGLRSATVTFLAGDVPSVGWRTFRLVDTDADTVTAGSWRPVRADTVRSDRFQVTVDGERGGGLSSILDLVTGRELLQPGEVGNELRVYDEYPEHPRYKEGPWHLLPSGPVMCSAGAAAQDTTVEQCALGSRVTVRGVVGPVAYTQVVTLWQGVGRVELTTHVEEFSGGDQLVRVRFPCSVPGALPVSGVAGAVVGRGFALPDVDSASAPWTLDNPAYSWFGLGSTARVSLRGVDGVPIGRRALGVAEIVFGDTERAAELGRDLAVALVRSGVTSTCAASDWPRYGTLAVDSNLPDVRLVVGGPAENALTGSLLAASPQTAVQLEEALASSDRAVLWIPAREPLRQAWRPNADLRALDALPVLLIAGADPAGTRAALASVVEDLDDAEIQAVTTSVEPELLDDYTVLMLERGTPGFAVDPSGALYLSLMRSCTGWPSGVWTDPPRRTTPDGSGFQLQHWSHTFSYALMGGTGDWRRVGAVAAGHEFNNPLVARVEESHPGDLAPRTSLLTVEPQREVVLTVAKPVGNPVSRGSRDRSDPAVGLTVRCYEATGRPAVVRVSAAVPFSAGSRADAHEIPGEPVRCDEGAVEARVDGCEVLTLALRPGRGLADGADQAAAVLGPDRDSAQPVFTRYWLHNKGPAPMGGGPVAVHLEPSVLTARPATTVRVTATVANDLSDGPLSTWLRVEPPAGWDADPVERPLRLGPGGATEVELQVTPPLDATPGVHFLHTVVTDGENRAYEDVVALLILDGDGGPIPSLETLVDAVLDTEEVEVAAGSSTRLGIRLANRAQDDIRGEAAAVSPWGAWDMVSPAIQPFEVAARDSSRLEFDICAAADQRPGRSWVLVKVMWYGHLVYLPAVSLIVR